MEKIGLGPLPAPPPTGRALSPSRAALLEALRGRPEPVGLADLVSETGLHRNTVREHMDALIEEGMVERHRARAEGRGRPAWLYSPTYGPRATAGNEYAALAAALATTLERTSDAPAEAGAEAGLAWGRRLAEQAGEPDRETGAAARRKVVEIFDRMGFAPEADRSSEEVLLTRCPLLEAAHESPTVVCSVHLGIVRGAMERYGQDGAASELHPFSHPRGCHLRLATESPRSRR